MLERSDHLLECIEVPSASFGLKAEIISGTSSSTVTLPLEEFDNARIIFGNSAAGDEIVAYALIQPIFFFSVHPPNKEGI